MRQKHVFWFVCAEDSVRVWQSIPRHPSLLSSPFPLPYQSSLMNDNTILINPICNTTCGPDPGWFIHQLEVRICFLSSAAWPPTSCTLAFPPCFLVIYGELITSSLLKCMNWISRRGSLIEDLRHYYFHRKGLLSEPHTESGGLWDSRWEAWYKRS